MALRATMKTSCSRRPSMYFDRFAVSKTNPRYCGDFSGYLTDLFDDYFHGLPTPAMIRYLLRSTVRSNQGR